MNFNLNIPAEVATFFHPHAPLAPPMLQTHAPGHNPTTIAHLLPVPQHSLPVSNMLISSDRLPGLEMTLREFCTKYALTDGVIKKLEENGYAGSHTFEYASWDEMREAGLKSSEIAQLRYAIMKWSTPRAS